MRPLPSSRGTRGCPASGPCYALGEAPRTVTGVRMKFPERRLRAILSAVDRLLGVAAIPLMMLLAALVLRALGFLISVIDTDEGLYLVQAQAWLRGDWPLVA